MTARLAPRSAGAHVRPGRLTDEERRWRSVKEAELQRQITDLAGVLGWTWVHFRAGMRANGRWQVAVEGPLGKGWPDLVLVRERDRRLVFVELKRQLEPTSADQDRVLDVLRSLTFPNCSCRSGEGKALEDWQLFGSQEVAGVQHDPGCRLIGGGSRSTDPRIEVYVWRPSDLRDPIESSRIYEVLR